VRERLHLREGWSSFFLLVILLLTMARSFEAGGLAEGLGILSGVVLAGAVVGLACAKLRMPAILAHLLGLVLGIGCCFLFVSLLIELPPTVQADGWLAVERARGEVLATRLQMWLGAAVHGESSSDALPFVAQMAGVSWLIAFYGAWSLFHSHWVWGAILPPGVALFSPGRRPLPGHLLCPAAADDVLRLLPGVGVPAHCPRQLLPPRARVGEAPRHL